ncbi:pitrilysin family protein [Bradyrhizobium sp. LHD-71]|uniref:M16 family metallopeptidase n=1 Tax=Bradyrhizobium sp. LHD-71 TaxID=3072141 RepID=UPI00280E741D|nr:pitrilysin family protein [Bradyrhizobium sp. LHD-71]MDQ8726842.1 pitrilysin family protein [Bradyrhizobium sp. LHD-71]
MRLARVSYLGIAAVCGLLLSLASAQATNIQRVVSPGGIEAWLVQDTTVPIIAMEYAFAGGSTQDPPDKPGVANLVASLLDEGAGDLDAKAFRERLERRAIDLSFNDSREHLRGSLRTLKEHRDEAFDLLRLALAQPRFDAEALERIRAQVMATLRRQSTSPNDIASKRFFEVGFGTHPYASPPSGTLDSVPKISADDLRDHAKRVIARDTVKISVVGDIDPATLGAMLDRVFAGLPAKSDLKPIPPVELHVPPSRVNVTLDVPQTVVLFGAPGIVRSDPDFMTAYVLNHILAGGMTSRLYREVREKRGLVYSISESLVWFRQTAFVMGSTATRADRANDTIDTIEKEIHRIAAEGPSQKELDEAKSYLKGSQMLSLDTSSKIAGALLQYQIDDLGIDYIDRRNGLIDAVTLDDAKRVAKRLWDQRFLTVAVGRVAQPTGN